MASANNIFATFAAAHAFSPSLSSSTNTITFPTTSGTITAAPRSLSATHPDISVRWNPHSSLPRSRRSSFLSLYGYPGPIHQRPRTSISVRRLPSLILSFLDSSSTIRTTTLSDLTRGKKKAVILSATGAFAPPRDAALSAEELVARAGDLRAKGAGVMAVVAPNDVFVTKAWGDVLGAARAGVAMFADPEARVARAMGLSESFCMVTADGAVVTGVFRGRDGAGFHDVLRAI